MIDTRLSAIKRLNNFYCIFLGATISWWIVFTKCPTSNFQFLFGFFFENFLGDVLCYLKLCKCFSEACCLGGFDECLLDFLDWFCLLNWTKLSIEENLRKWNGYEGVSNKKVVGWNIFFSGNVWNECDFILLKLNFIGKQVRTVKSLSSAY